jgi:hypothetical protein
MKLYLAIIIEFSALLARYGFSALQIWQESAWLGATLQASFVFGVRGLRPIRESL